MKSFKIYTILSIVMLFLGASCNVLDQENPSDIIESEVSISMEALRVGMYSSLQSRDYYGGNYPLTADGFSDNGATGGFNFPALDEVGARAITPSNQIIEKIWVAVYKSINAANNVLTRIDNAKDLDEKTMKSIKGEALFVRALSHFDALRMWGAHWDQGSAFGIPVVNKPQGFTEIVGRSSVAGTYAAILADLKSAEALITDDSNGKGYITHTVVNALSARVYLYANDNAKAVEYANKVIDTKKYVFFNPSDFLVTYTGRQTRESVFELIFDAQNQSIYNFATYSRPDAFRTEISYFASSDLDTFFMSRKNDVRAESVNFKDNDASISPDGRSEKYRGEKLRDNPAYIIRYAEILLIAAEAKGKTAGLADLNTLHTARGMAAIKASDVSTDAAYTAAIQDERRAELNMEGHRYFDLARIGQVETVLGIGVLPVFPIPFRELTATKGAIKQYPGY